MRLHLCIPALVLLPVLAGGAEIYVGESRVKRGEEVTAPVGLAAKGQSVASLQFDLEYNGSALELKMDPGPVATQAAKDVISKVVAPGRLRVLLVGTNRTVLKDGAIAILTIKALPPASPGRYPLKLSNLSGADAAARKIELTGSDGRIVVH